MHADSIHFPDSLKFNTLLSNRTVYGGGGIMPDIFIPIDSTRTTDYHLTLNRYGILNKMTISYLDENRKNLNKKYPDIYKFKKDFSVTEDMLNKIISMAEEEKIEFNEEQYNKSKEYISLHLKAIIANNLFDPKDYYNIINEVNDSYRKALEIINNDQLYYRTLRGNIAELSELTGF